jgi:SWI/SNF-related matrix-associated actin-dependent regulator 1 of chromatin subfamily A
VIVTWTGTELIAKSSFAEKDLCKACGLWWQPTARRWGLAGDRLVRLQAAQLTRLAGYAGDPATQQHLLGLAGHKVETIQASRAVDANVEIPVPAGLQYLPFQKAGIAFAAARPATLLADEPGLGKTIQVIGVVNSDPSIKTVLVVCPVTLQINWAREACKWSCRGAHVTLHRADGTSDVHEGSSTSEQAVRFHVVGYQALVKRADLQAGRYDLVVSDEAHLVKNPKAQRTLAVKAVLPGARRRMLLTGTPIVNRPAELFTLVNALDHTVLGAFMTYAKRFCQAHYNGYGWDFSGAANLDELQEKLRGTLMIRRLKSDVLRELPAKTREIVVLPANGTARLVAREDRTALDEAREAVEQAAALEDQSAYDLAVDRLHKAANLAFDQMSATRHDTALAKVGAAVDHIKTCLEDNDSKLVVFAHHQDVVQKLAAELAEFQPVVVTGQTAVEDRQAAVDRFQADPTCRVFIGNILAAGVGLTLTASSHVAFVELDWVPGNVSQAEDRCHRIGQRDNVLVQHLVVDGSMDVMFAEMLIEKQRVIDQALDIQHSETAAVQAMDHAEAKMARAAASRIVRQDVAVVPAARKAAILEGVRVVAGQCDGVVSRDGMGFNKADAAFGHRVALMADLTDRQAHAAARMLSKYRRTQLPAHLVATIWPEQGIG